MPYIINHVPKVVHVPLGSKEMMEAANVYATSGEAYCALQLICAHNTKIGNRSTGHIQCADCHKPFN